MTATDLIPATGTEDVFAVLDSLCVPGEIPSAARIAGRDGLAAISWLMPADVQVTVAALCTGDDVFDKVVDLDALRKALASGADVTSLPTPTFDEDLIPAGPPADGWEPLAELDPTDIQEANRTILAACDTLKAELAVATEMFVGVDGRLDEWVDDVFERRFESDILRSPCAFIPCGDRGVVPVPTSLLFPASLALLDGDGVTVSMNGAWLRLTAAGVHFDILSTTGAWVLPLDED